MSRNKITPIQHLVRLPSHSTKLYADFNPSQPQLEPIGVVNQLKPYGVRTIKPYGNPRQEDGDLYADVPHQVGDAVEGIVKPTPKVCPHRVEALTIDPSSSKKAPINRLYPKAGVATNPSPKMHKRAAKKKLKGSRPPGPGLFDALRGLKPAPARKTKVTVTVKVRPEPEPEPEPFVEFDIDDGFSDAQYDRYPDVDWGGDRDD